MAAKRIFSALLWLFFIFWLILQVIVSVAQTNDAGFIDFKSYIRAIERLASTGSPYLSISESLEIWRTYHRYEVALLDAHARGKAQEIQTELKITSLPPSAYVYPPTLALIIQQFHISPVAFAGLLVISVVGFSWLWLQITGASNITLLLVMFSWDVLASFNGGNVELLLLFATLLSAWLIWNSLGLIAGPLIALILLVKPFYILFFLGFVLILLFNPSTALRVTRRSFAAGSAVALALIAAEVYRWGPYLRAETLAFFSHAMDYSWFVMPPAEQTPLSAWNRTPLQALVSAGLPLSMATAGALGLWILFVGVTIWQTRNAQLTFALSFTIALVLLYWGRPVGWGLNYLPFTVVVVAWPKLNRWQKTALVSVAVAFMFSHWWAFILTAQGKGMPLLTLQSAELPWETWLVIPLSWLLLLYVTPKPHKWSLSHFKRAVFQPIWNFIV